jgi:DNA-binding transcriptional MerR regulator
MMCSDRSRLYDGRNPRSVNGKTTGENGMAPRGASDGVRTKGETPIDERLLSIGDLAKLTGVSRRTIRYYEELGILPEPPRSPGGTRKYPEGYRFYIEGALSLKQVGFNLDEVRLVGRLALGARLTAAERTKAIRAITEKRQNLEHKIRVLNKMHEVLEQETSRAEARRDNDETPRSQRFADILAS